MAVFICCNSQIVANLFLGILTAHSYINEYTACYALVYTRLPFIEGEGLVGLLIDSAVDRYRSLNLS